jgi:type III restriction enzyme
MSDQFFEKPILNSPYDYPRQHWELDETGQPTRNILNKRRRAEFITPIPKPKKRKGTEQQMELGLGDDEGLSTSDQKYTQAMINELRKHVDACQREKTHHGYLLGAKCQLSWKLWALGFY